MPQAPKDESGKPTPVITIALRNPAAIKNLIADAVTVKTTFYDPNRKGASDAPGAVPAVHVDVDAGADIEAPATARPQNGMAYVWIAIAIAVIGVVI
jgi:hypothetical protein